MVSSIVPGANTASIPGVDARFTRPAPQAAQQRDSVGADRVEVSSTIGAARDSVRDGLMQVHQALAIGHDAQAMLVKAQGLARASGAEAQAQLSELLTGFQSRLKAAVEEGAALVGGRDLSVQAEPGATPVTIGGADLQLGGGVIEVGADAKVDDAGLANAVQRSLEALQEAMSRLLDSARSLEAHQGFLNAAAGAASSVRHDLDADGARLLALQARQGLQALGSAPIANVEPQAVLSLFRA